MSAVAQCYLKWWDASRYELRFVSTWASDRRSVAARLRLAIAAWLKCCMLLATWRPHLVHIHFTYRGSFYRKAVVLALARAFGIRRIVLHCHSHGFPAFYEGRGRFGKAVIRRVLLSADLLIVIAEPWEKYFRTLCPRISLLVLHNPVECPVMIPGADERKSVLLTLGVLGKRKGTYDILRAVPQVVEVYPSAEFWLGGDGETEQVSALIADSPWGRHVRLLGWVQGTEKHTCLRTASVFLLPSYSEGLPVAVLEAMAYGLPVITTPVGGIPDAVIDEETGVLVQPGDVPALVEACLQLLGDLPRRTRLGTAARRHAVEHFAVESILGRLYRAYDGMLQRDRA
jgi:glycosyltransferase involved in cell wall biosynthesis